MINPLQALIDAIVRILTGEPRRTSWVYCYHCRHDLNGDNASFVYESPDAIVSYLCTQCRRVSLFDFGGYPVPVRVFPPQEALA